ncbi:hypothetical protein [Streptomyces sp. NPDC056987]|uniref:hypothetical protein n=1 Tax=Streptomyces sp. NPDC056987 TaxID=3345988 RepID=UPI0036348F0D
MNEADPPQTVQADQAPGRRHGRRWLILAVIATAQLMVVVVGLAGFAAASALADSPPPT